MGVVERLCLVIVGLCLIAGIALGFAPTTSESTGYDCGGWFGFGSEVDATYEKESLGYIEAERPRLLRAEAQCDDQLAPRRLGSIGLWAAGVVVPGLLYFVARGKRSAPTAT